MTIGNLLSIQGLSFYFGPIEICILGQRNFYIIIILLNTILAGVLVQSECVLPLCVLVGRLLLIETPQSKAKQSEAKREKIQGRREAGAMNLAPMKDHAGPGGNGGGMGPNGATTTIPSLKRTLSGGAAGGHGGGHLGVGMNAIPSVLHAAPGTNPPQMLRAVTSSGAYNRPSAPGGGGFRGGAGMAAGAGAGALPATRSVSVSQSSASMQDWRMFLTIEERQAVRSKIRDAYTSRCATYEDLLQVVRACATLVWNRRSWRGLTNRCAAAGVRDRGGAAAHLGAVAAGLF